MLERGRDGKGGHRLERPPWSRSLRSGGEKDGGVRRVCTTAATS